ncbi:MAG TPA: TIGR03619 family F420-dependent LLM class oxidoreductase [Candidatus Limnocylindrales bacterium]|nr:TIGR03619 family F420-dependent LLM class oxidoreductase [Candidatus Limnocylindrales bacterium]
MKFSTGLPNCREGRQNPIGAVTPAWLRTVTTEAERLGYYSIWLNEFLQTEPGVALKYDQPPSYYDPLVTIGHLAALTKRIRFVTSTIVLPHHHPILLNRQVATLDALSNGRLTLGIGLGGSADEFRSLRGDLGSPNRGQMMDEFVDALRALWTQRRASFSGQYVKFENVEAHPQPVQDPLPIFMAGEVEGVFRRLARSGQGWIDYGFHPEPLKEKVAQVRRYVREARGADAPMEITRQFYVSLGQTRSEAEANRAASVPAGNPVPPPPPPAHPMEPVLVGTPAELSARLREYVDAGVTEICAIFYSPDAAGAVRQMELFAREVMPAVGAVSATPSA